MFVLPASWAQERLWFLDRYDPGSALFNVPCALFVDGPLSPAALGAAFAEVARRHETLRTTFALDAAGELVQVVVPARSAREAAPPRVDLSALPAPRAEAEALRLARREVATPFDLAAGPLWRLVLVRLAADRHLLIFDVHHVVFDGWSLGVLLREVTALYAAALAGRRSPLPEPALQYADFAAWQRAELTGDALEAKLAPWREWLDGAPRLLELPMASARPAEQSHRGARRDALVPAATAGGVHGLARRLRVTPFTVFLAAFQALLGRLTGQDDLVVGTAVANRQPREVEGLIGFFANTLPLRADLGGDPSFAELVARVRKRATAAFTHQDVPFERLVDALAVERNPSHNPLIQVIFLLEDDGQAGLELAGAVCRPLDLDPGTSKYDLALTLSPRDGGYQARAIYATDLLAATAVDRLLSAYRVLLAAAVDGSRAADRRAALPRRRRPSPDPLRVERHRSAVAGRRLPPPGVRRAGDARPGGAGDRDRPGVVELRRAEPAGEPARPSPASARRRSRGAGRGAPRPHAVDGGGGAGGRQGRRRLRAAGDRLAAGAGALDRGAPRGELDAHRRRPASDAVAPLAADGLRHVVVADRPAAVADRAGEQSAAGRRSRRPRLHHLHLRLDRPPQGGGGPPPAGGQPRPVGQHHPRGRAGRPAAVHHRAVVRPLGLRPLRHPGRRCHRPARRRRGAARPRGVGSPAVRRRSHLLGLGAGRSPAVRRALPGSRRRGLGAIAAAAGLPLRRLGAGAAARPHPRRLPGGAGGRPGRRHRGDGVVQFLSGRGGRSALAVDPLRPADRQRPLPRPRPELRPLPAARPRRSLHRRRLPLRGLRRRSSAHRRAVPAGPFRPRLRRIGSAAGRPPLSHRRPRPLPARRQPRVPRPPRYPGKGARLPHRAGRDRGGARRAPGGGGGGGAGARGRPGRPAAGGLLRAQQRPAAGAGRAAPLRPDQAARLHGAGGVRRRRRLAAGAHRQARPQGAAGAGSGGS